MFRIVTGSIIVLIGLGMLSAGWHGDIGTILIGLGLAIVGVVIILNQQEDTIEEIINLKDKPKHHE